MMALSQPVQDPTSVAELLRAQPARTTGRFSEEAKRAELANGSSQPAARRSRSLTRREFEVMLGEFQAGLEKARKLRERIRRGR